MTEVLQLADERDFHSAPHQKTHWATQLLDGSFGQYRPVKGWAPAINLYECRQNYWVIVELAGLAADEIAITVEDGRMVVSGRRPTPDIPVREGEICMHLMEIDHGPFIRSVDLPSAVDVDSIKASYRGGYLSVRIPKKL